MDRLVSRISCLVALALLSYIYRSTSTTRSTSYSASATGSNNTVAIVLVRFISYFSAVVIYVSFVVSTSAPRVYIYLGTQYPGATGPCGTRYTWYIYLGL